MNQPNHLDHSAWESAMSRDFDARVRALDEAPLSLDHVKGKATTIRRHRRIAAATGVLAVAAVITPIAVIAADNGTPRSEEPGFAEQTGGNTDAADPDDGNNSNAADGVDYLVEGTWVRADGTEVDLPREDYSNAVVWDDQLVVQHREGNEEWATTEIIDADGAVVDSFETSDGLAVSHDHSILAYVASDGRLMTKWDGGEADLGGSWASNDLPTAVQGQAPCAADSGACTVWVDNGLSGCRAAGSSDAASLVPENATSCRSTTADRRLLTVVDEHRTDGTTCGGVYRLETGDFAWRTCDYQAQQFSPDGAYVAAPPSQYDALGPMEMSVLDAETGEEAGRYAVDLAAVADWSWSDDNRLVLLVYDTVSWHLVALTPGGGIEELTDPIEAGDLNSPFVLVGN